MIIEVVMRITGNIRSLMLLMMCSDGCDDDYDDDVVMIKLILMMSMSDVNSW